MKRPKTIKLIAIFISCLLIFQQSGFAQVVDISSHLGAFSTPPTPDIFRPLHLRYLSYDSLNNNFKLLLDKGSLKNPKNQEVESAAKELLNYFFVGLTLPNDTFWVNLRPDSPDNIIDPLLAQTDVGKILLESDLQLKKDTANFTSPETPEGKEYWDKLYKKAGELFGSENVTIPTLTRPWIVPDEIIIRETQDSAYIYKATLKVMLEQDYLKNSTTYSFKDDRLKALNEYSSHLIRQIIIPKLNQEINSSKRYAALRQVYYSLIMAQWFKVRFANQNNTYSRIIDKKIISSELASKESWSKNTYFQAYQKSFKDGEYNIKEQISSVSGQNIRSYFSGGIQVGGLVPQQPGTSILTLGGGSSTLIETQATREIPSSASVAGVTVYTGGQCQVLAIEAGTNLSSNDHPGDYREFGNTGIIYNETKSTPSNQPIANPTVPTDQAIIRDRLEDRDIEITIDSQPWIPPANVMDLLRDKPVFFLVTATYDGFRFNFAVTEDFFRKLDQKAIVERVKYFIVLYEEAFKRYRALGGVIKEGTVFNTYFAETAVGYPGSMVYSNGTGNVFTNTIPFEDNLERWTNRVLLHEMGHILARTNGLNFESSRALSFGEGIANYIAGDDNASGRDIDGVYHQFHISPEQTERISGLSQIDVDISIWGSEILDKPAITGTLYFGYTHHFFGLEFINAFIETFGQDRLMRFLHVLNYTEQHMGTAGSGSYCVTVAFTQCGYSAQEVEKFEKELHKRLKANVFKIVPPETTSSTAKESGRDLGAQVSDVKNLNRLLRLLNVLRQSENIPLVPETASDSDILEICIRNLEKLGLAKSSEDVDGNIVVRITADVYANLYPSYKVIGQLVDAIYRWVINPEGGVRAINFQGSDGRWRIVGFSGTLDPNTLEHERIEVQLRSEQGLSWQEAHEMAKSQMKNDESTEPEKRAPAKKSVPAPKDGKYGTWGVKPFENYPDKDVSALPLQEWERADRVDLKALPVGTLVYLGDTGTWVYYLARIEKNGMISVWLAGNSGCYYGRTELLDHYDSQTGNSEPAIIAGNSQIIFPYFRWQPMDTEGKVFFLKDYNGAGDWSQSFPFFRVLYPRGDKRRPEGTSKGTLGAQVANVKNLDRLLRLLNVLRQSESVSQISVNASDREILESCIENLEELNLIEREEDSEGNVIIRIKYGAINHENQAVARLVQAVQRWVVNSKDGAKAINFEGKDGKWVIMGFSELSDKDILEHEQFEVRYRKQGLDWITAHNRVVTETGRGKLIDTAEAAKSAGQESAVGAASRQENSANPGGIDFRNLPIVRSAIDNLSIGLNNSTMNRLSNMNLVTEWRQIESLVNSGIIPSAERIKDYVRTSCYKGDIDSDINKIIVCISDILRQEEESYFPTDPVIRDILVVLDSANSAQQLKDIFIGKTPR